MHPDSNTSGKLQRRSQRIPVTDFFYLTLSSSPFSPDTKIAVKDISRSGMKFITKETKNIHKGDFISAKLHINSKLILPIELKIAYTDNEGIACMLVRNEKDESDALICFLNFLTVFMHNDSEKRSKGLHIRIQ
jgi:hypothetical protein